MKILYKTITVDTQVSTQECWLVGVELNHTGNCTMTVYDEADSGVTAARTVVTMKCSSYVRQNSILFPRKGVHCEGIYVNWDAGVGTIYYHY